MTEFLFATRTHLTGKAIANSKKWGGVRRGGEFFFIYACFGDGGG